MTNKKWIKLIKEGDESSVVIELLENNEDEEDFKIWLQEQENQRGGETNIVEKDLRDLRHHLTMGKLKEYAESEYSDLGLASEFQGVVNLIDSIKKTIKKEM